MLSRDRPGLPLPPRPPPVVTTRRDARSCCCCCASRVRRLTLYSFSWPPAGRRRSFDLTPEIGHFLVGRIRHRGCARRARPRPDLRPGQTLISSAVVATPPRPLSSPKARPTQAPTATSNRSTRTRRASSSSCGAPKPVSRFSSIPSSSASTSPAARSGSAKSAPCSRSATPPRTTAPFARRISASSGRRVASKDSFDQIGQVVHETVAASSGQLRDHSAVERRESFHHRTQQAVAPAEVVRRRSLCQSGSPGRRRGGSDRGLLPGPAP